MGPLSAFFFTHWVISKPLSNTLITLIKAATTGLPLGKPPQFPPPKNGAKEKGQTGRDSESSLQAERACIWGGQGLFPPRLPPDSCPPLLAMWVGPALGFRCKREVGNLNFDVKSPNFKMLAINSLRTMTTKQRKHHGVKLHTSVGWIWLLVAGLRPCTVQLPTNTYAGRSWA